MLEEGGPQESNYYYALFRCIQFSHVNLFIYRSALYKKRHDRDGEYIVKEPLFL